MEATDLVKQVRETLGEKKFSEFSLFCGVDGGIESLEREEDFIDAIMRFVQARKTEVISCDFNSLKIKADAAKEAIKEWRDLASAVIESRFCFFADLEAIGNSWMVTTADACVNQSRFGISCHGVGVVYIMELPNGVKIGKTSDIQRRLKFHVSTARNFGIEIGRVAFSEFHGNYSKNEKLAHSACSQFQVSDSEFFAINFDEAIKLIGDLEFLDPNGLEE